jgi:hypothetical protein
VIPEIRVEPGDVLEHECDVLVVKYAQARYGTDEAVARALVGRGQDEEAMCPQSGGFRLLDSHGAVSAQFVMFAGVDPLPSFGYRQIRVFARKALEDLAGRDPSIKRVAYTMHGAGYGLDEREAFESLVAGFLDALGSGDVPSKLVEIAVVERNPGRARRLAEYLSQFPTGHILSRDSTSSVGSPETQERLREVGYASDAKPHIFVAMPFSDAKSDHYHYGIEGAVHTAGYLCERIDLKAFTGDILERIKQRISTAEMVVADLSGANPNAYLEVGYAWGKNIPTVLLSEDAKGLRFDVQGQRCLTYTSIRDLETKLTAELSQL